MATNDKRTHKHNHSQHVRATHTHKAKKINIYENCIFRNENVRIQRIIINRCVASCWAFTAMIMLLISCATEHSRYDDNHRAKRKLRNSLFISFRKAILKICMRGGGGGWAFKAKFSDISFWVVPKKASAPPQRYMARLGLSLAVASNFR